MDEILKGRPVALQVLDYGLFRVHANGRVIGISGFLVTTDVGERVLIDGGFPAKYATDPAAAAAEDRLGAFGEVLDCRPVHRPEAQLALCGVAPEEITLLIQTHTHIDHVGAMEDFPQAPMLIAAAERALPRPLYWGDVQPLDWPARDTMTLDADLLIGPGFDVILAPGHAPGQLAMLLELPETGAVLLTSDAVSRPAEIDEGFDTAPDPAQTRASAARLMELARARDAMIIWGHCPAQWLKLKKAPDAYR